MMSGLLSGSPGAIDGPDGPPLSIPSRESRRSPPSCDAAWQAKHCVARMGRILFSKKSEEAGESAASSGTADRTMPAKTRCRISPLLILFLSQSRTSILECVKLWRSTPIGLQHGREPEREEEWSRQGGASLR